MERVSELPTRGAFVCGVLLAGWNVHGVFLDLMECPYLQAFDGWVPLGSFFYSVGDSGIGDMSVVLQKW
jgi:hypothetical protein